MDLPIFEEHLEALSTDLRHSSEALVATDGWNAGRCFEFVEHLRRCREVATMDRSLEFEERRRSLAAACDHLQVKTFTALARLDDQLGALEAHGAELTEAVTRLKQERDKSAHAADQEALRARLSESYAALRRDLHMIGELRRRCDEAGLRAQRSGGADDARAFRALIVDLGEHCGREHHIRDELETLESELAKMPKPAPTKTLQTCSLLETQSSLAEVEVELRSLRYQRGSLALQSATLVSSAAILADLQLDIAATTDRIHRISARHAQITREVRNALTERGVTKFLHFTAVANLPLILSEGLRSRSELERQTVQFVPADLRRLDSLRNTVSLSIEFPNYRMLYQKLNGQVRYAILELDPDLLLTTDALFHKTNAASGAYRGLPVGEFLGARGVFVAFDGQRDDAAKLRAERRLPQSFPLDPQAEVLICSTIAPAFIRRVIVQDTHAKAEVERLFLESGMRSRIDIDATLFGPRIDWQHWTPDGTH